MPYITTKTGDTGSTSLLYGTRVPKTDIRIHTCGTIDELSASLGMSRALLICHPEDAEILLQIQNQLIHLMSETMVLPKDWERFQSSCKNIISQTEITELEAHIAKLKYDLPPCHEWGIPGANNISATLHIARTVCRRAERTLWKTIESDNGTSPAPLTVAAVYLNRLADYLWLLARKMEINLQKHNQPLTETNK